MTRIFIVTTTEGEPEDRVELDQPTVETMVEAAKISSTTAGAAIRDCMTEGARILRDQLTRMRSRTS